MGIETRPWDTAEFLDSPEAILASLVAAFEDGDPGLIVLPSTTGLGPRASRKTRRRRKATSPPSSGPSRPWGSNLRPRSLEGRHPATSRREAAILNFYLVPSRLRTFP